MNIKIADYTWCGGSSVEYDADAPCLYCGQPVVEASMGGTAICPWCDTGYCRVESCTIRMMVFRKELDGGKSLSNWRRHISEHIRLATIEQAIRERK